MNSTNTEEKIKVGYVVNDDGVILQELFQGDKIVSKKQQDYQTMYISNFQKREAFR